MKDGTIEFIAVLLISCLPNPSMNYLSLGLHPLALSLSHSQWRKNFDLLFEGKFWNSSKYQLAFSTRADRAQLHSEPWTVLTHLFVHRDGAHLANNMASIATSALYLDLGFMKSTLLFFLSGMGGAAALLLEKVLSGSAIASSNKAISISASHVFNDALSPTLSSSFAWIKQQWSELTARAKESMDLKRPRVYLASGCSAAAFGFMGVEIVYIGSQLYRMYGKKYTRLQRFRAEEQMAKLLLIGCWKVGQVWMVLDGVHLSITSMPAEPWTWAGEATVGHSAHLGGLLIGLIMAPLLI